MGGPRFGPDGRLYYSVVNPHGFPAMLVSGEAGGATRKLGNRYLGTALGFAGSQVVFDQMEIESQVALQSDLYLIDLTTGERKRLTHGARAADPDVSPDGRTIACTIQRADRRELATLDLAATAAPAHVLASEPGVHFAAPRWSPDGRWIAVERVSSAGLAEISIDSRRCIVADVSAPALYGELVDWRHLPPRLQKRMARFEWDPGTVKVDWALDGPIPWTGAPKEAPGTVHLATSVDALAVAGAEVAAGVVPAEGLVLVGQMATTDPSRAPSGAESVWAYTHVPSVVRHTSPGSADTAPIERGPWSRASAESMADRVQARIERQAPGFADRIVARRVLGPTELESLDDNLRGGALNGGTAALQQQLVFRPVPGLGRAETPVKGLYLGSASAHPGGGVHGACGSNAARAALAHARVPSWRRPAYRGASSAEV